jgi:hypothetical protein
VTPDEARQALRSAAQTLASGESEVLEFYPLLMGLLHDLCRDEPLDGYYLAMFNALEGWEAASGDQRSIAESRVRNVAQLFTA